jgi:hypothetical protein
VSGHLISCVLRTDGDGGGSCCSSGVCQSYHRLADELVVEIPSPHTRLSRYILPSSLPGLPYLSYLICRAAVLHMTNNVIFLFLLYSIPCPPGFQWAVLGQTTV